MTGLSSDLRKLHLEELERRKDWQCLDILDEMDGTMHFLGCWVQVVRTNRHGFGSAYRRNLGLGGVHENTESHNSTSHFRKIA